MGARPLLLLGTVLAASAAAAQAPLPPPQVAALGECPLEGGAVIRDCQVRYRVLGRLDAGRRNAVLVTTWFGGDSDLWLTWMRLPEFVDTTRHFVVVVDAFGSGRSSSPSTSRAQPGAEFPRFTVRDMVAAQRRLLWETLGVRGLHAVMGYSMGGMQALQWGAAYPADVERLVAMAPSPRLTAYDRVLWEALVRAVELGRRHAVPDDSVAALVGALVALTATTPARVNERPAHQAPAVVSETVRLLTAGRSLDDLASQARAMLAHDVAAGTSGAGGGAGELARAARATRARTLVVYSPDDHLVTPQAAAEYARLLGAEVVAVPSRCGHFFMTSACERPQVAAAVRRFLAQP
jgi:homoserine O-acetyltransferase/O-succinyltransferase